MVKVFFAFHVFQNPDNFKKGGNYIPQEIKQSYPKEKGYYLITPHTTEEIKNSVAVEAVRKKADQYIREIILPIEGPGKYSAMFSVGANGLTTLIHKKHYNEDGSTSRKKREREVSLDVFS